jgi:hypothetical protein
LPVNAIPYICDICAAAPGILATKTFPARAAWTPPGERVDRVAPYEKFSIAGIAWRTA